MNNIYYFTGTGNSLQIAEDVAAGIGKSNLYKVSDYSGEKIAGEALIIVFPAYDGGIPLIIERFLKHIEVDAGMPIYVITNCNNIPGMALPQCKKLLEEQGRKLSGGWVIKMPGNYIPMYGANSETVQAKKFAEEKEKVSQIIEVIKAHQVVKIEQHLPLINKLFYKIMYKNIKDIPYEDKNFVVTDACIGCGLCSGRCPVHNIEMKDGRPNWQHHCEFCLGCLQYCPKQAIEYGKASIGKERYQNPNVKRRL